MANPPDVTTAQPHNRRLFGKVLMAFYKACDDGEVEVATILLDVLKRLVSSSGTNRRANRRRSEHDLVAAHEWLRRLEERRRSRT
jgi:hypothetical protein